MTVLVFPRSHPWLPSPQGSGVGPHAAAQGSPGFPGTLEQADLELRGLPPAPAPAPALSLKLCATMSGSSIEPRVMICACNPSTPEAGGGAGGLRVQGQPGQHSETLHQQQKGSLGGRETAAQVGELRFDPGTHIKSQMEIWEVETGQSCVEVQGASLEYTAQHSHRDPAEMRARVCSATLS